MSEMNSDLFKFFSDQVVRQYQELKADFKSEMASLKAEINKESLGHNSKLDEFKDETTSRFVLTDERLTALEKFNWRITGAGVILIAIIEVGVRVLEKYF